jgi:ATP-dependent Clp protease protease subunit
MAPGSFLMIHQAWTLAMGNADDMAALPMMLEQDRRHHRRHLRRQERQARPRTSPLMQAETWFTPRRP